MVVALILLLAGLFFLVRASQVVISSLTGLARLSNVSDFMVAFLILAVATSLPEFFVGLTSALRDEPSLSFGNIIGANVFGISLIPGLAAIVGQSIGFRSRTDRREIFIAGAIGLSPLIMAFDGQISRGDGLLLILLAGFGMAYYFVRRHRLSPIKKRVSTAVKKAEFYGRLLGGIVFLYLASELVIVGSNQLAGQFLISLPIVGAVILSLGTTLPEMSVAIKSVQGRHGAFVFGNMAGSLIVNSGLILGMVSLIRPIEILDSNLISLGFLITLASLLLLALFTKSRSKLTSIEGLALIGLALAFILGAVLIGLTG